MSVSVKNKLNPRHEKFCRKYVQNDFKGTDAAIYAGFSKKTAASIASRLLKNVNIQKRIKELQGPRLKRLDISAERVLREVARLALVDPRKMYDKKGNLKNVPDLDDDTAAALSSVEIEELFEGRGEGRKQTGRIKKVRMHDKKGSLELLMKHLKLINSGPEIPEGVKVTFEWVKKADA